MQRLQADARFEDALGRAYRHLGRRDRAEAEVRGHLEAHDVDAATVEAVVAELCEQGYLDDARYARRFAEDRRALDGWGAGRIARRLADVGVASELIDAALECEPAAELEAALVVLRGRMRSPPRDDRARERALGLLVRRGYELEVAYQAVRAFERED